MSNFQVRARRTFKMLGFKSNPEAHQGSSLRGFIRKVSRKCCGLCQYVMTLRPSLPGLLIFVSGLFSNTLTAVIVFL